MELGSILVLLGSHMCQAHTLPGSGYVTQAGFQSALPYFSLLGACTTRPGMTTALARVVPGHNQCPATGFTAILSYFLNKF